MSTDGHCTLWRRNIAENFNPWVGCTNVTDRRQTDDRRTDGRWHIANMNLSLRSLKTLQSVFCVLVISSYSKTLSGQDIYALFHNLSSDLSLDPIGDFCPQTPNLSTAGKNFAGAYGLIWFRITPVSFWYALVTLLVWYIMDPWCVILSELL